MDRLFRSIEGHLPLEGEIDACARICLKWRPGWQPFVGIRKEDQARFIGLEWKLDVRGILQSRNLPGEGIPRFRIISMLPEIGVHRTCTVARVRDEVEIAKTQAPMNETDLGRAWGKDDIRFGESHEHASELRLILEKMT